VEGSDVEKAAAFRKAFTQIESRIKLLTSLSVDALHDMTQTKLREIGNSDGARQPS
jgi:hypothetical protein